MEKGATWKGKDGVKYFKAGEAGENWVHFAPDKPKETKFYDYNGLDNKPAVRVHMRYVNGKKKPFQTSLIPNQFCLMAHRVM